MIVQWLIDYLSGCILILLLLFLGIIIGVNNGGSGGKSCIKVDQKLEVIKISNYACIRLAALKRIGHIQRLRRLRRSKSRS